MKKTLIIAAFAVSLFLFSGCDFFRRVAGRPTSAELMAKRAQIEINKARVEDAVPAGANSDSRTGTVSDKVKKVTVKQPASFKGELKPYYLVIGSFVRKENATRLVAVAKNHGYEAVLLPVRNGFTAVAICPSETEQAARSRLGQVLSEPFCPVDIWIIENQ